MGKRVRSTKSDNIGKGKVTPAQIAFIVDRYLSDNNYTQSRSAFRAEASSLIAKSPINDAPRGLLSLGAMLNEYISLKEEKVMMEQERIRLDQEKWRIQTLLQGMQGAMNAYNAAPSLPNPAIQTSLTKSVVTYPQSDPRRTSQTGFAATTTPTMKPPSMNSNIMVPQAIPSCLTAQPSSSKRKHPFTAIDAPSVAKKPRAASSSKKLPINSSGTAIQSNGSFTNQENTRQSAAPKPNKNPANVPLAQGSSIAKRLFYPPLPSTPTKSPTTPQQETTPSHCTVFSYEKITVSPSKEMPSYTIERTQCTSTSTAKDTPRRDHVKGRLDFEESEVPENVEKDSCDSTSTSESDKDIDIFDLDFVEALGADFSFSELMVDLDLDSEALDFSCQPMKETISGLSSMDNNHGVDQFIPEHSTTVTEIHSEEDVQIQGVNNMMTMKSIMRCTSVVSPVKNPGSCTNQENCNAER